MIPHLIEHFDVITLDLPGFGKTKLGREMNITNHAEIVGAFIQTLDLDKPPFVLGHSYGSLVVTKLHELHPSLTDNRMILVSPVATPVRLIDIRYPGKLLSQLYFWSGAYLGPFGRFLLKSPFVIKFITRKMFKTKDPLLQQEILEQHIENTHYIQSPKQNYKLFCQVNKTGVVDSAKKVNKSILIINGDSDIQCPAKEQRKAIRSFRHGELMEIEGAGHLSHYEVPEAISKSIATFLLRSR